MGCSLSETINEEFVFDAESRVLNECCRSNNIPYFFTSKLNFNENNNLFQAIDLNNVGNSDKKTPCYIIKLLPFETQKEKQMVLKEFEIIDLLNDESIFIKYIHNFEMKYENKLHKFLVMPFYDNYDLYEYEFHRTPDKRPLLQDDKCYLAFKMLKILEGLKIRHIVHNDIKLENFVLKSRKNLEVILIDFETAEVIEEYSTNPLGTLCTMAPEKLLTDDPQHDYAADMWSLGVSLHFLLYHYYPFEIGEDIDNIDYIQECITQFELVKPNDSVDDAEWELISAMLEKEPQKRITVEQALKSKWFKNMKHEEQESKRVNSVYLSGTSEADKITQNETEYN